MVYKKYTQRRFRKPNKNNKNNRNNKRTRKGYNGKGKKIVRQNRTRKTNKRKNIIKYKSQRGGIPQGGVPQGALQSVKFVLNYDLRLRLLPSGEYDEEPVISDNLQHLDDIREFAAEKMIDTIHESFIPQLVEESGLFEDHVDPLDILGVDNITPMLLNAENNKLKLEFELIPEGSGGSYQQLMQQIKEVQELPSYMVDFYHDYSDSSDLIFTLTNMEIID
jgi:hypothetical protein